MRTLGEAHREPRHGPTLTRASAASGVTHTTVLHRSASTYRRSQGETAADMHPPERQGRAAARKAEVSDQLSDEAESCTSIHTSRMRQDDMQAALRTASIACQRM